MSEELSIRVNFGKPMPVFPLHSVTLMPHAVLQLHIHEGRYKKLIADALDGAGQIAMAVYGGGTSEGEDSWKTDFAGRPIVRPAVCVGQIVQHHRFQGGEYNIILQGVCRARITNELPPDDDRPYRAALMEPVGIEEPDEAELAEVRERLNTMLSETRLADLKEAAGVCKHLSDEDVPTSAIVELITFQFLADAEVRYKLLAEGDPARRANVVEVELIKLKRTLDLASLQRKVETPKGCSWN